MATNFPTSLDSYTTKVDGAGNKIFAAHINDPQSAIEALEAKVGIDGSAVTTSLDYLIANKVVKNDQINTITANSASALLTLNQQGSGYVLELIGSAPQLILGTGGKVGSIQFRRNDGTLCGSAGLEQSTGDMVFSHCNGIIRIEAASGGNKIQLKAGFPSAVQMQIENTIIAIAVDFSFNTTTGTKIGTANTQKIGFWGLTPVIQPAAIVDADGTLADITTKFNDLLAKMRTIGIISV